MNELRSIIITGMHRSHTSLIAQGFQKAGLYLGDDLIGAAPSNPYGHFESKRIVNFHQQIIKNEQLANRWSFMDQKKAVRYSQSTAFYNQAREKIKDHIQSIPKSYRLFGWKDPRGCFFLNGWHDVLPSACFVFVVRHPIQCVRSLNHRTRKNAPYSIFPFLSQRHFNLWDVSNTCILEFVKAHPHSSIVIHAPDGLINKDGLDSLNRVVAHRWKMKLSDISFDDIIDYNLLQASHASPFLERLYRHRSKTQALYEQLVKLAL